MTRCQICGTKIADDERTCDRAECIKEYEREDVETMRRDFERSIYKANEESE